MKLCASRAFWLVAHRSQGHEMLFDAHTRSFAALAGRPRPLQQLRRGLLREPGGDRVILETGNHSHRYQHS